MTKHVERNKALVLEAMTALFQRHDARAVERLYAPDYIQHNPNIPQGGEALARLVAQLSPAVFYEPGLIVAEGDFVAIHGRIRGWAPKTQIAVDIFRIEDGLLAEHWDVLQDEAPTEAFKSGFAMFSPEEGERQKSRGSEASLEAVDYDRLMKANLSTVFSERNEERRRRAVRELYSEDAVLHEPHASACGHAAISDAVGELLAKLPGDFVFTAEGPALGHNSVGRLKWRSGPKSGSAAVTGLDVAQFEGGRICSLYVFLDPQGA
jgi:predicted SnoaL-like aldol condensation-catalyzing enzyme